MTIEIIKGNLLTSDEGIIAHGCNTQGVMGAGIAGQIAKRWPEVLKKNREAGTDFHPGAAQMVLLGRDGPVDDMKVLFNLATQDAPGPNARYDWVHLAFRNMAEQCALWDIERVAIPQIGCGIGGLQWNYPDKTAGVEDTIEGALANVRNRGYTLDVVCYVYTPRKGSNQ